MSSNSINNINLLALYEQEEKLRSRKFFNTADIIPYLMIPSLVYTLINMLVAQFIKDVLLNSFILVLSYVGLLFAVSYMILHYKNAKCNKKNFILSGKEVSIAFSFILMLNSIYLSVQGLYKGDKSILIMLMTNIMLYVGFVVSLEDIFEIKRKRDFLCCFFKPFRDIGVKKSDWWKIGIGIIVIVGYSFFSYYITAIFVVLFIVIMIFVLVLNKFRDNKLELFGNQIITEFKNKRVFILQIGADYVIMKTINKLLDNSLPVYHSGKEAFDNKYDVIVVLNTLRKKEKYMSEIKKLNKCLMKNAIIIDPFVYKKRRSFLSAWFGLPLTMQIWDSTDEYIKALD